MPNSQIRIRKTAVQSSASRSERHHGRSPVSSESAMLQCLLRRDSVARPTFLQAAKTLPPRDSEVMCSVRSTSCTSIGRSGARFFGVTVTAARSGCTGSSHGLPRISLHVRESRRFCIMVLECWVQGLVVRM